MSELDPCLLAAVNAFRNTKTQLNEASGTILETSPGLIWGTNEVTIAEVLGGDNNASETSASLIAQIVADRAYNQCMDGPPRFPNSKKIQDRLP